MENNQFNFNFNGGDDDFIPASEKQIAMLQKLGYQGDTTGLTKTEASQIIKSMCEANQQAQAQQNQNHVEEKPKMENNNQVATKQQFEVAEKNISDKVLNQINSLQENQNLVLPKGYNVTNALKSAYLILSEKGYLNTDKTALAEALLNMCIQGLNPAKNQCYFIPYNNKVSLMRSYFGDRAVAINTGLVKDVQANIIYQGDTVDVSYVDNYMVVNHTTKWENMSKPIVGAYAFAILPDGRVRYDIMTLERIKKSWAMSKNKTNNQFQTQFDDDACKRTVIRHLVKNIFNETGDSQVVVESYNKSTADEYITDDDYKANSIGDVNVEQASSGTKGIEVGFDD